MPIARTAIVVGLALTGCGRSGVFLDSDKNAYELSPVDGALISPVLVNQTPWAIEFDPCNVSLGQSVFGYSSLERESGGNWAPVGSLKNQYLGGCYLKVGCGLEPSGRSRTGEGEVCAFEERLDPSDGVGTYRFVTHVKVVRNDGAASELREVVSNVFEVRAQ